MGNATQKPTPPALRECPTNKSEWTPMQKFIGRCMDFLWIGTIVAGPICAIWFIADWWHDRQPAPAGTVEKFYMLSPCHAERLDRFKGVQPFITNGTISYTHKACLQEEAEVKIRNQQWSGVN